MTPQQKRELIAEAECNPRTLDRWLMGRPMKPPTKERLDNAARALGLYSLRGDRERVKATRRTRGKKVR
jgi:hypothetical protein